MAANDRRIGIVHNYILHIITLTQASGAFLSSTRSLAARGEAYKEATTRPTSANATDHTINERFLGGSRRRGGRHFTER